MRRAFCESWVAAANSPMESNREESVLTAAL
jgi:hypothetical protein